MMRRLIQSALATLLAIYCFCQLVAGSEFVYVCRDAGAGGYQAFPDICRLQDGRLTCAFYASHAHIGLPCTEHPKGGRISYCISTNEGRSWSKARTLYDGPDDDRDPSIVQLKNGQLICDFFILHRKTPLSQPMPNPYIGEPYTELGTWIVTSDDLGRTWTRPRQLYTDYYASSPIRELSDGRLIMPLYRQVGWKAANGAVGISDDHGKTWSKAIDIPLDKGKHFIDAETDVIELKDEGPLCSTTDRA